MYAMLVISYTWASGLRSLLFIAFVAKSLCNKEKPDTSVTLVDAIYNSAVTT